MSAKAVVNNQAIVFVKPHAHTPSVIDNVYAKLTASGCLIQDHFDVHSKQILVRA
jgi:hypothetical protein